jgi:hypothetical protein
MTKALCWQCGEFKFGVFNPCPACNAEPENQEEILLSLVLTDRDLSEDEMVLLQGRIRGGTKIEIDQQTRNALLPVVEELKRISGFGSQISAQGQTNTPETSHPFTSWVRGFHRWISKREPVAILLFHAWRTSLIVILLLAIISAFQGNLVYLWNPVVFGAIQIGIGHSSSSIFLGRSNLKNRLLKFRSYLITTLVSILALYFVNSSPWSIPLIGLQLSASSLSLWAGAMGVLAMLRGDFDGAL